MHAVPAHNFMRSGQCTPAEQHAQHIDAGKLWVICASTTAAHGVQLLHCSDTHNHQTWMSQIQCGRQQSGCCLQANGLKLSNSWAGYHILLNPDYSAQILWRFVNRAIDEVENDRVLPCLPLTVHYCECMSMAVYDCVLYTESDH